MSTTSTAPRALVDLHGRSPWTILPGLCLGFFMIMVDMTIVNIAVPTLVKTFNTGITQVGWVNSAYLLTFAVLLLVTGRLGDRFGPRPIFMGGLVVFTLASAACGLAPTIGWLIAARAVQGVGGAMMTPQTMAMITRVFPPRSRGAALGVWGSVAGVATITGPLLGALLIENAGWEWIFYVNVPVGIAAMIFSIRWLPKLDLHQRTFDILGMVLSIVGLFLVVFGMQEGSTYDWGTIRGPITVWGVIATGVVVLIAFGWLQVRRGEDALLPMRLFKNRTFFLANTAGAALGFAMVSIFFPLTIFLQSIMGLDPIHAALVTLPGSLISGFVAPAAGRLSDRVPPKWIVAFGFAMFTLSVFWLASWIDADASPWRLLAPMALFGLGTGTVFSPLGNLAASALDYRTAGAGAGVFNTNRQVGSVIGSAAMVALLTSRLSHTIMDSAVTASQQLPEQFRAQFVGAFSHLSAADFSGAGANNPSDFPLPPGIPANVATQVRELALGAVHDGFATAVSQSVMLAAIVFFLGLLACLAMKSQRIHHEAPAADATALAEPALEA
jgi:EmrB/QacA subfamily drug resistance transporter